MARSQIVKSVGFDSKRQIDRVKQAARLKYWSFSRFVQQAAVEVAERMLAEEEAAAEAGYKAAEEALKELRREDEQDPRQKVYDMEAESINRVGTL